MYLTDTLRELIGSLDRRHPVNSTSAVYVSAQTNVLEPTTRALFLPAHEVLPKHRLVATIDRLENLYQLFYRHDQVKDIVTFAVIMDYRAGKTKDFSYPWHTQRWTAYQSAVKELDTILDFYWITRTGFVFYPKRHEDREAEVQRLCAIVKSNFQSIDYEWVNAKISNDKAVWNDLATSFHRKQGIYQSASFQIGSNVFWVVKDGDTYAVMKNYECLMPGITEGVDVVQWINMFTNHAPWHF